MVLILFDIISVQIIVGERSWVDRIKVLDEKYIRKYTQRRG